MTYNWQCARSTFNSTDKDLKIFTLCNPSCNRSCRLGQNRCGFRLASYDIRSTEKSHQKGGYSLDDFVMMISIAKNSLFFTHFETGSVPWKIGWNPQNELVLDQASTPYTGTTPVPFEKKRGLVTFICLITVLILNYTVLKVTAKIQVDLVGCVIQCHIMA